MSKAICISALMALCFGCATTAAEPDPFESIRLKLCRPIHPQFGAGNFDILDYPQQPNHELLLSDLRDAERTVNVPKDLLGRIIVLVEVNPTLKDSPWKTAEDQAPGLAAYSKIRKEFADQPVEFVTIWTAADGKGQVDADASCAYVEKHKLSGLVLLNSILKKRVSRGTDNSAYYAFAGVRIPGHRNKGTDVCILNKDGLIVYRAQEEPGMPAVTTRDTLRRANSFSGSTALPHSAYASASVLSSQKAAICFDTGR